MRSSVSVILSSPPPDDTMSYPDYQAHPHHHRSLLVLVAQLGSRVKSRSFQQLYERISRVNQVRVSDSGGTQRPVWVTYRKEYPVENNDWGDFQTHRRLLAIITIGQVGSQNDLNEVCKQHESLKVKYASTIYDSRCIILGLNSDGSVHQAPAANNNTSTSHSTAVEKESCGSSSKGITVNGCCDGSSTGGYSSMQCDRDSGVYETLPPDAASEPIMNGHAGGGKRRTHSDSCSSSSSVSTHSKLNGSGGCSSSDSGSESTAEGVVDGHCSSAGGMAASSSSTTCSSMPHEDDSLPHDTNSNCSMSNNNGSAKTSSNIPSHQPNNNCLNNNNSGAEKTILQPPSYFKTRAMFYPTCEHAVNIETTLQEFISSLFWVVESKRLDKSQEKLDRPPLLCAPFERKDMVGLDMDSRASRKRCVGRLKKQLGDLCLQVGLVGEAAQHYSQAADILRACNDWLWLAGCLEGSCAASAVQLYPDLGRNIGSSGLQRNSSLGVGPTALKHRQTNSLPSNSLPPGLPPSTARHLSKHCLTPDSLVNKYREAIVHYSKYRNAGVVETEASIKAVYVLIEQRKYLLAAEFLSNVVFINLQLSDEEKIGRFKALAELYQELGMMRKAGFFRRVAAMRCAVVQPQRSHDWPQCYRLLLNTLPGYRLTLDPLHFLNGGGWGALQVQLIQEIVGTSRRMGAHEACCKHQSFLLAALYHALTPTQRQEAALMLHTLTHQAAQATAAAEPNTGNSLSTFASSSSDGGSLSNSQSAAAFAAAHSTPHVNLLNIPLCKSVKILAPKDSRQLHKKTKPSVDDHCGPFIFSPFASLSNAASKPNNVVDFEWIEGEVCELVLHFENILTIPLQLTEIKLLTEGSSHFESWSSSVVLEAESSTAVTVRGQPTSSGELKIMGYVVTALGVTSTCRFKHLQHLKVPFYIVQVVSALPLLQVDADSSDISSDRLTVESDAGGGKIRGSLVAGETRDLTIALHNSSSKPVLHASVVIKCKVCDEGRVEVFKISEAEIAEQLPLAPGATAKVTLSLYGFSDFLAMAYSSVEGHDDGTGSIAGRSGSPSFTSSVMSAPATTLSSRGGPVTSSVRSSAARSSHGARSQSSSSFFSSGSSSSAGSSTRSSGHAAAVAAAAIARTKPLTSTLEGDIEIWYSGESDDHWRICHLLVKLQVVPTLQIIKWDVLPGEEADKCYLVLDLLNRYSSGEMELTYTDDGRCILVQAGDTCRVPVPITRCPRSSAIQNGEKTVSEVLGAHVSSQVQLKWMLGPQEIKCRASLPQLHFSQHTHYLMMLAPITWDVKVGGSNVSVGGEASGKVGQSVTIDISLTNSSEADLPPLHLSLSSFQDHQNGNSNYRTDGIMAPAGAMAVMLPKLVLGKTCSKKVNLVYFTAGVYKLELRCCPQHVPTSLNQSHVTTVGGGSNSLTTTHNSSLTILPSHSIPPSEVWVFAPPIEITISH